MKLPSTVNGWSLLDVDSAEYYRESQYGHEFIDMTWLDITAGDSEYGTGREYCVCTNIEDAESFEDAEYEFQDLHHTDQFCISGVVTREEAIGIILDYVKAR